MRGERYARLGTPRRITELVMLLAVAPMAHAQIAVSANYQLDGMSFANTGGGVCSTDGIAYTSLGEVSGSGFASLNFQAGVGFLEAFDPDLPSGLLVFGVTPKFGTTAGGTLVTVSGFNFDKFGAGPSTVVFVGGVPASGVNVTSNTTLSFVTPAGLNGPRSIIIANSAGTIFVADGFVYAPAITTTPIVPMGSTLEVNNYGAPGDTYLTFVSTSQCVLPAPPYGVLLVGPFPLIQLLPVLPYGFTGQSQVQFPVPIAPAFAGLSVYFQSVSFFAGGGPPPGKLTNSSTTVIQ